MSDMFGAAIDFASNIWTQELADERQDDQQAFNSAEALANRTWQEHMSNTSVQRNVADMRAAGINPLLSVHPGGGASTPSGSTASSGIANGGQNHSIAAAMASASQVNLNEAAAEKMKAEAKEVEERTKNYGPQRDEIEARIPVHREEVNKMQQEIAESGIRIEKIWQEVTHLTSSAKNLDQNTINLKETIGHIRAQINNLNALSAQASAATSEIKQRVKENLPQMERILLDLERKSKDMSMSGHANAERAQDSLVGQIGAYLKALGGIPGILSNSRSTTINRHTNIQKTVKVPK